MIEMCVLRFSPPEGNKSGVGKIEHHSFNRACRMRVENYTFHLQNIPYPAPGAKHWGQANEHALLESVAAQK